MIHSRPLMVRRAAIVLAAVLLAAGAGPLSADRAAQREVSLDDLVWLSQITHDADVAGCGGVSVFAPAETEALFRSTAPDSPDIILDGLVATTDFRHVFGLAGSGSTTEAGPPQILRIRSDATSRRIWSTTPPITGAPFTYDRSIAILPDDETLLVEEEDGPGRGTAAARIAKYCLSEVSPDGNLGPRRGSLAPGPLAPFQIIADADGRHAHLVPAVDSSVLSIDSTTMQSSAPPIVMPTNRVQGDRVPQNENIGSISPDGRYIVTGRWIDDALAVVDLVDRQAWLLPMNGLCPECIEVAFNHGPLNHGLLAVRAPREIAVFEFAPRGPLRKLGRLPVAPPPIDWRHSPLAWSGDGSRIIVGAPQPNGDEFLVIRVEDGGRVLAAERALTGCPSRLGVNYPQMILTANRRLQHVDPLVPCVPPTPTPTVTLTPSATPIWTGTRTATSTPTRTLTVTPSPTELTPTRPVPTSEPSPIYLPLLLREHCTPGQQRVDVALVIDASLSMEERTRAGITKLAAARHAAATFLDALGFELGDQAAVIAFNSAVDVLQPLTGVRADLDAALQRITTTQQTRIDLGLEAAGTELASARRRAGNSPVVVLLTDGRANPVGPEVAERRAEEVKRAGVTVFTIGLGQELDTRSLQRIASSTDRFYHAPEAEQLAEIYGRIAVTLPCPAESFWGGR
jgi:Mg-chelatase subunit ChlD